MAHVFRVSHDHLRQYDYVRENERVQTLIGGNRSFESARDSIHTGEAAFFWMNKKQSPFGGDGRAIFARGVIEEVTPCRVDWAIELVARYRTAMPDSASKLCAKECEPHATIRVIEVLAESEVLTRESLSNDPELLAAIELPPRPTAKVLENVIAGRLAERFAARPRIDGNSSCSQL